MKIKIIFLVQFSGYVSELQVRINKIDDFGAITAYKIFSMSWFYLLDHYLGFPK